MERNVYAVLLDGSEGARRALRFAADLAKRTDGRIAVVSPFRPQPAPEHATMAMRTAALEDATRRMQGLMDEAAQVPIEFHAAEVLSSISRIMLEFAERDDCAMLVLPKRGPAALMRMLGDDTQNIVKRSPVPVVLVP